MEKTKPTKVALLFICLNEPYWPYVKQVIEDCNKNFLSDHRLNIELSIFLWTDLPEGTTYGATVFPTDPQPWPTPTLMRYHLFLQQEETLKDFDYLFYLDADMRVVAPIGREIMGDGLTAAEHPMYALAKRFVPPYEPNKDSAAYIPRLGLVTTDADTGNQRFKPLYAAGGFQGGKTADFIDAMKAMRKTIDADFDQRNYVAIWNDETHWNRYLFGYSGPLTILSPSYIYPDSLIKEYYEPIWGCSYEPKIITLTKPFSLQKIDPTRLGLAAPTTCTTCGDTFGPELKIVKILQCNGSGKPHGVEQTPA